MPFDGSNFLYQNAVTQLLIEGRARVEQGWCRHAYQKRTGEVCMAGALGVRNALSVNVLQYDAIQRLRVAINGRDIEEFNDARGRTKEDILEVYDRAIAARF